MSRPVQVFLVTIDRQMPLLAARMRTDNRPDRLESAVLLLPVPDSDAQHLPSWKHNRLLDLHCNPGQPRAATFEVFIA